MVIKAVFGNLLTREKSVDILKSKFDVKQSNLTNLTPSQVMSVLVKQLVRHNYVTLKENASSLGNVTVHKEIAIQKNCLFSVDTRGEQFYYIYSKVNVLW